MMKNNRHNIIECCNNTQQGAPRTGKKRALALRTSMTPVTLLVIITPIEGLSLSYGPFQLRETTRSEGGGFEVGLLPFIV